MAKSKASTQQHLDIEDVQDDLVILKNGDISLVLETTSLNFELLADEEQDARILSFASLLNAVQFPIQIVIRTERTDVNDYIDKLQVYRQQQTNEALRRQMEIYMKFVKNLTVKTEVLNKRFFVVIPKRFAIASKMSLTDMVLGKPKKVDVYKNLEKAKEDLYPKRDLIISQFKKVGIKAWQMKNDELVQMFYDIYDPDKVGVRRVDVTESGYTSNLVEVQTQSNAPATADQLAQQKNGSQNSVQQPGQHQNMAADLLGDVSAPNS